MLTLPKIYRGTHLPHPKAELLRGAKVTIEPPMPLPVQLDGEQPGTTPVRFEVVPSALRLRVPAALGARRRTARLRRLVVAWRAVVVRRVVVRLRVVPLPSSLSSRRSIAVTRFWSGSRLRSCFCIASMRLASAAVLSMSVFAPGQVA